MNALGALVTFVFLDAGNDSRKVGRHHEEIDR